MGVVAAFLLTYWIFIVHMKSQNLYDANAEQHAFEHSAVLAFIYDILQLLITFGVPWQKNGTVFIARRAVQCLIGFAYLFLLQACSTSQ